MPIPVQCEQCEARYLIEDRFAGKRAKCKRCGHAMSIPHADAGASGGESEEESIDVESPSSRPPLTGVTSMPGRAWRPQDVGVEREGDVQEFSLRGPSVMNYGAAASRPTGKTV